MRAPGEIRRQLIAIRDRNLLVTTVMAERARVTRAQLLSAINLKATEDTLRKIDAFLDAPKLHQRDERAQTLTEYYIETLAREMYWRFKLLGPHPKTVAAWSYDKQRLMYNRLTWRAKFMLQKEMLQKHQIVVRVSDGATYWQYKRHCFQRLRRQEALRPGDRDASSIPRESAVGEGRRL